MSAGKDKRCYLSTSELQRLDVACVPLQEAFPFGVYLVGSAEERADYRDVDVRVIMQDEEFDRRYGDSPAVWSITCLGICEYLRRATGLNIDFQIQRQTEANEKYGDKRRNALGHRPRLYAGGGDATRWLEK